MIEYKNLLNKILDHGIKRDDRTGTGTIGTFGERMEFDLRHTFPAVTTKKLAWRAVVSELLWFIEGSRDERRLAEILHGTRDPSKKTIWTENAEASYWKPKAKFEGDLGAVYGVQWRSWPNPDGTTTDQLTTLIEGIKKDPFGRRHVLTAWNPGELQNMALPPCHMFAQFYVHEEDGQRWLSCQMYQRSADAFLGVPFNIASYALLTHMIAQVCDLKPYKFVHIIGDAHVYLNHIDAVKEQLSRNCLVLPVLKMNPEVRWIDGFSMFDFELVDYESHDTIKAKMAV